jgi:hypothetical protein
MSTAGKWERFGPTRLEVHRHALAIAARLKEAAEEREGERQRFGFSQWCAHGTYTGGLDAERCPICASGRTPYEIGLCVAWRHAWEVRLWDIAFAVYGARGLPAEVIASELGPRPRPSLAIPRAFPMQAASAGIEITDEEGWE